MAFTIADHCPECGCVLKVRRNRADGNNFIGCSGYPTCRFATGLDVTLEDLAYRMDLLEKENDRMSRSGSNGSGPSAEVRAIIKNLIFRFHPDRNDGAIPPSEVTAALTDALGRLR